MKRTGPSVGVVVAVVIGLFWSTAAHAGSPLPRSASAAVFNVKNYGALGDGPRSPRFGGAG